MDKTFEQMAKDNTGTIYEDGYENGVRYLIMRGPAALCAYVGVPSDHPLSGRDYDDIPLEVHGGLTYASQGKDPWPTGWFWYGWDYAHAGDVSFYDLDLAAKRPDLYTMQSNDKAWTLKEVKSEIWYATWNFARLVKLAESLAGVKPKEPQEA